MPSTPTSTAKHASSFVKIPLSINGSVVMLQQIDPNTFSLIYSMQIKYKI
jgi:hypothetical protein